MHLERRRYGEVGKGRGQKRRREGRLAHHKVWRTWAKIYTDDVGVQGADTTHGYNEAFKKRRRSSSRLRASFGSCCQQLAPLPFTLIT